MMASLYLCICILVYICVFLYMCIYIFVYLYFQTIEDEDGELHFECQHGERECAGNIVQVEIIRNTIHTFVISHKQFH